MRRMTALLPTTVLCPLVVACGSSVNGHVYHNNGGVVQVEFKSGGRAYVSAGRVVHPCSYSESGKLVSLVCDGNTTEFQVQVDGVLVGPANGLMARLTPIQN
jgi:hypothetical protein